MATEFPLAPDAPFLKNFISVRVPDAPAGAASQPIHSHA